jgi:hypothetical protein
MKDAEKICRQVEQVGNARQYVACTLLGSSCGQMKTAVGGAGPVARVRNGTCWEHVSKAAT